MNVQINVELPEEVFSATRSTPEHFVKEIRLAAAVKWYEMERISQAKAAEIAGVTRHEFLKALDEFSEKKDDFYGLINNFIYLSEKDRKSMTDYLDEFYALIDGRKTIIDRFSQECGNF